MHNAIICDPISNSVISKCTFQPTIIQFERSKAANISACRTSYVNAVDGWHFKELAEWLEFNLIDYIIEPGLVNRDYLNLH